MDSPKPVHTHRKKLTTRAKVALWLILGPTVLIAVSFILFTIINAALGNIPDAVPPSCTTGESVTVSEACKEALFGTLSQGEMGINNLFAILGLLGALVWLPGMIIGIVLLVKRPKPTHTE